MAEPHITITLGRSGQKVVKDSYSSRANASVPSVTKRSWAESFGNDADHSLRNSKRVREDVSARSYGNNRHIDDSSLSSKDLRVKLTRKRISRRMELENEERKKMELHEKVSRAIRSLESADGSLLRSIPSSKGAAETLDLGSMSSVYASLTSDAARTRSPLKSSAEASTPRNAIGELQRVPSMRPMDVSRTEHVLMSGPLDSFRPKVPMLNSSRPPLDSGKVVAELPPATGGVVRPPHQDNQPLTVTSFLHSLGLGKYAINFKAEEIDMIALKQMGDGDLKELGIPMGPRRKILFALQARAKRPVTQGQINYEQ
ncbi:hypothetical protein CDL12_03709 [Handroanthus impetiginosus]|uniref:SAM domain-containing protein n=1 Tax=Handroanthus impetiginosus TaxID=429701 RepID=A0A2G9I1D6_9LAMI|nr:hypothetical protein CDL12_03709 [Handroanthus impetiginosus]